MKQWRVKKCIGNKHLQRKLGISYPLSVILQNRNIKDLKQAQQFLFPSLSHLNSPFLFRDMEKSVTRVKEAIRNREKILIWGDEDVDGMSATALLFKVIEDLGGNVAYWVPRRSDHGIGLSRERIDMAVSNEETLIITVDCGSSDAEMVTYARQKGIDVIVTDHHEVRNLPNSYGFLNPKSSSYPFKHLAGVGVSLKLALALTERALSINATEFFRIRKDLLPFILLGTVSDRVSLLDENRTLIKNCLDAFPKSNQPYIQAIIKVLGLTEPVVEEISERIIPVLSAGRGMESENPLMRFFFSDSVDDASEILGKLLDAQQVFEEEFEVVYRDCVRRIGDDGLIVLDDLPLQFLGSCASRLVKETGRPSILMGYKSGDVFIGEARAPADFNLVEFFAQNEDLFMGFGGHKPAAGFSISGENIELFKKRASMIEYKEQKDDNDVINIDVLFNPDDLPSNFYDELMLLPPYGEGNPKPILAIKNIKLEKYNTGYKLMNHPISVRGILEADEHIDIVYHIDDRGILRLEDWRISDEA